MTKTLDRANLIDLLRTRSYRTGSFTLASGKPSSFYIDARLTTMSGPRLEYIGRLGHEAIVDAGWSPRAVGGLTLGADPVAYAIAMASRRTASPLDAFTVRKAPKDHGTGRLIEGCFSPTHPVVVVEDVLTTGGSALQAIQAVSDAGGSVLGVVAVVDREEGGRAAIEKAGFTLRTLVRLAEVAEAPA